MKHIARKVIFVILMIIILVSIRHYTKPVEVPKVTEYVPLYYAIGNEEIGEPISYVRNNQL